MVIVLSGEFIRLVDRCKQIGIHPELHAGPAVVEIGAGRHRGVVELRLTHDDGKIVALEPLAGLGDRDRAAGKLIEVVGL